MKKKAFRKKGTKTSKTFELPHFDKHQKLEKMVETNESFSS